MTATKPLDLQTLASLSALLEQCLALEPGPRERWLQEQEVNQPALGRRLRSMMARYAMLGQDEIATPEGSLDRATVLLAVPGGQCSDSGRCIGDQVGPYKLTGAIGEGGMGSVWRAQRNDGVLDRTVALKLPHVHQARGLAERFARERDILATLAHPNIARLYDAGTDAAGQAYLAMELVEGEPIDQYCASHELSVAQRLNLLLQVARALAHAHAHLVVHRDLKPSNIQVSADAQVHLLDFGIAKLLDEGSDKPGLTREIGRIMTPDYASPEQVAGAVIGTASDVYSLGVVAYELLCGQRPYRLRRASVAALEDAILESEVQAPSTVAQGTALRKALRGDLDAIVLQALRKDPTRRYASVEDMARDIERHLQGLAVQARGDSASYRALRFGARHRLGLVAAAAVLVAVLGGTTAALWQAAAAREQARQARVIQEFMLDIFRARGREFTDPARMEQTTARELLDAGVERVDQALAATPQSKVPVLGVLADMYFQLGDWRKAYDMQQQALALARTVLPGDDPQLAQRLLALANLMNDGSRHDDGGQLVAEAGRVLDAAGDHGSAVRGEYYLQKARHYRYEALHLARSSADEALEFFSQHPGTDIAQIKAYAVAAQTRILTQDYAGAERLLRRGKQLAQQRGADADRALIVVAGDLAEVLHDTGRFAEAEATWREALAASERVFGRQSRSTKVITISLVTFLLEVGGTAEGVKLDSQLRATLPNPDFFLANTPRTSLGEKASIFRKEVDTLSKELPRSTSLANRRRLLGLALIQLGRMDEAAQELEAGWHEWSKVTQGLPESRSASRFLQALAQLRLEQGRPAEARDLLQAIDLNAWEPEARPLYRRFNRDLALAQSWADDAQAGRARQAVLALLEDLKRVPAPYSLPQIEGPARVLLGRLLLAQGQWHEGLQQLEHAVRLAQQHETADSLRLADAELALAQGLFVHNQGRTAQAWLGRAQDILKQYPGMSPKMARTLRQVQGMGRLTRADGAGRAAP